MELKIEEQQELQPIKWNFAELKKELEQNLEKYQGKVVTEEGVVEAKQDRANLNKLSSAINNKKIEIKKQYMAPYSVFEVQVKELLEMISKPVLAIDSQVKKFEEAKREDKLNQIKDVFVQLNDNDHITFKMIYSDKWLNVAYKMPKIKEEVGEAILKIEKDLIAIETFKTEFEVELINKYLDTLDLSVVMQEKTRLEKTKEIQEQKKAQPVVAAQQPVRQVQPEQVEIPETHTVEFRVVGTKSQIDALKQFLLDNKIKFGRVQ